jgi:hypothetical protein
MGFCRILCGNLTPGDRLRFHMRLSKEPLGQVMGNPRAITAKKVACAIFLNVSTHRQTYK